MLLGLVLEGLVGTNVVIDGLPFAEFGGKYLRLRESRAALVELFRMGALGAFDVPIDAWTPALAAGGSDSRKVDP